MNQNEFEAQVKYIAPSAKTISFMSSNTIMTGSNLEDPKRGEDWDW